MKILHMSQVLHAGVGSMIEEIVPYQIERWGAENVALVVPEDELTANSPLRSAQLFTFPSSRRSAGNLYRAWAALRLARREFSPDIEHLHSTYAGVLGRLPTGGSAPQVYCPHGWAFSREFGTWKGQLAIGLASAVERRLGQRTDAIVMVSSSEQAAASKHGVHGRRDAVILNSISDREFECARRPGPRLELLFLGRLVHQKAPEVALDMMAGLGEGEAHLTLIGAAPDGSRPADTANVTCLGWITRQEVQARLAAADVLVLPSRWEGLPMSALEAFRAGTAVLISDAGNSPELVRDGVEGRIVVELTGDAFRAMLRSHSVREWRRFGANARASYLDRFTSSKMNAELAALYQKLVA